MRETDAGALLLQDNRHVARLGHLADDARGRGAFGAGAGHQRLGLVRGHADQHAARSLGIEEKLQPGPIELALLLQHRAHVARVRSASPRQVRLTSNGLAAGKNATIALRKAEMPV